MVSSAKPVGGRRVPTHASAASILARKIAGKRTTGLNKDNAGLNRDNAGLNKNNAGLNRDSAGLIKNNAGLIKNNAGLIKSNAIREEHSASPTQCSCSALRSSHLSVINAASSANLTRHSASNAILTQRSHSASNALSVRSSGSHSSTLSLHRRSRAPMRK